MKKYIFLLLIAFTFSNCRELFINSQHEKIIVRGDGCNIGLYQVIDGNLKQYRNYSKANEEYVVNDLYEGVIKIQNSNVDTLFNIDSIINYVHVIDINFKTATLTKYQK